MIHWRKVSTIGAILILLGMTIGLATAVDEQFQYVCGGDDEFLILCQGTADSEFIVPIGLFDAGSGYINRGTGQEQQPEVPTGEGVGQIPIWVYIFPTFFLCLILILFFKRRKKEKEEESKKNKKSIRSSQNKS